ncbi:MAG TPA: cbb3-type cytochrome c oxidase subunit 3 [Accumulibacter sp.]|uniref:cbb3-type cytochrome oxidase subunit 3 n=1 Tax=Accumulibacter sp. TaxID=2053492 RepID=UPI002604E4C2|nr:cbb3-type cytochrome c oxidase subunit 3 [Accumulibacter sp.]HNN09392.1 cbb3-type cytochrome c oxidase subunit 3 [Azospira sp.]MDS4014822.1 cbb3-type cytochrome c oxidase subunit 3 [Accumulibacter sp.]MDS4055574.1 cbb3-type cytochrome c oxidase subunit 3 [Accumulibacter sp.]HMV04418.1 cbb3-type cytochrome c oxidase subunit 3 [Accumulibacter sp.]HMW62892.1 cbb3-type cytochrome c oxidase subunit 3 [Accumulibacter sp.]
MDINDLRSVVTVVSLLTFLGVVWWAYGVKANKKRFEEAAMLPFADEAADRAELGLDRNRQRKAS